MHRDLRALAVATWLACASVGAPRASAQPAPPAADPLVWIARTEFDPEDGGSSIWVYPNGFVHATGHASCCGYRPPLATGWYRVRNTAALRDLFRRAADWVRGHPHDPPAPMHGINAAGASVTIRVGERDLDWAMPGLGGTAAGTVFGLRLTRVRTADVPAALRQQ